MKYLIFSDIHGSVARLRQVMEVMERQRCDMMIILGDILNYGPRNGLPEGLDARGVAETLNAVADKIIAVRGNCDSEVDQMLLRFPIMSTYALLIDEGRKILLTHGHVYSPTHLPPGHFDAVMTGHTHLWTLEKSSHDGNNLKDGSPDGNNLNDGSVQKGETVFLNTGSITFPKGGNPPTYAIMENGAITVYNLSGEKLKTMHLQSKLSVFTK